MQAARRRDDQPGGALEPLPCFVHINKNGGTSLRSLIDSNYGSDLVYSEIVQGRVSVDGNAKALGGMDEDVYRVVAAVQAKEQRLGCIATNLPYGLHAYLRRPLHYFAFLREPVSRCRSYWQHAYRLRETGNLWAILEKYDLDIEVALRAGTAYQFSNDQVRLISGCPAREPGEREYELARENIERAFVFVGAIECFDPSVSALARRLHWKDSRPRHSNVASTGETGPLPARTVRTFKDANEWDARLHAWLTSEYLPRALAA